MGSGGSGVPGRNSGNSGDTILNSSWDTGDTGTSQKGTPSDVVTCCGIIIKEAATIKTSHILILVLFLLWTTVYGLPTASAAVPHLINYQGRLTDKSGQSLEGFYKVTLRIHDAETGPGTMTPWEEAHPNVIIQKGVFSILLGSVKALDLAFDKPYWLKVKVGEDVMGPRQQMVSSAYAMNADNGVPRGGRYNVVWKNFRYTHRVGFVRRNKRHS